MKSFKLLIRIIIAIILGIAIGFIAPEWLVRIFATFNDVFGNFLSFIIPLIILSFIASGIGTLGKGAGKLLSLTAFIAYASTIIAGIITFFVAKNLFPLLLRGQTIKALDNPSESLATSFFTLEIVPPIPVITALILAFIIGLGITSIKGGILLNAVNELRDIIQSIIVKVIIPFLPFHIFGIFANMTYANQVGTILNVFAKVFMMIILLHSIYLLGQYTIAGILNKQNPITSLKIMSPAYFTALGTQSSAATIPVTLERTKQLQVKERLADFTIPLLANIHLSGSTITLVSCSMAIMFLQDQPNLFVDYFPFILMLGITMIAAPGIPGGSVMAALGLLDSMLGFDQTMVSLIIALYIAQDSLGTACNVTGDGAITSIVHAISRRRNVVRSKPY